jgi:anti-sigma factor RsiW
MKDPVETQWRERCWRRKLGTAERQELRAWLKSHPEAQPDLEVEMSLNKALGTLKDAPVASNFTARLLAAVERDVSQRERVSSRRRAGWWENFPKWLPGFGVGAAVILAGLFSYQQFQTGERQKMLDSVTAISEVATLPSPEILQNYEAIRAITLGPDEDLLVAMIK